MLEKRNTGIGTNGIKNRAAFIAAAVVYDNNGICRLLGKVFYNTEKLVVRFICGDDNDHEGTSVLFHTTLYHNSAKIKAFFSITSDLFCLVFLSVYSIVFNCVVFVKCS